MLLVKVVSTAANGEKVKQGKQCFQRWNRCVRFKVVWLSSSIPWDLRHAEQLLFLCPCSNLTVYRRSFFAHPLCASLSCLQNGISFGNKKPDNVDRDYIVKRKVKGSLMRE